ncbi:YceI family protein [Ferruginibacter sp. SUN106]|uniref:YceI family protein n=1 Tax=Ferruginibacter sp. SUN106 TaxID=2978348 RepID=UPI003D35D6B5
MINETKWSVDTGHSEIAFKVRHLMIAHVKGSFKIFDANIYTTEKDFTTAQIDLWIDTASLTTGDEKRDEHLKSADFFDVEHHKQITFTASTMQQPDEKGQQELWGELTMKGITKNVKLTVEFGGIVKDPWGNEKAGFTVTGKIKRSDWELTWNTTMEAGGLVVGDEITITCELELINAGKKDLLMEVTSVVNENVVF